MQIKDLSPQEVYRYFSDIVSIPHGSNNTGALAEYCVNFANEHNFKCIKDSSNNVIIYAPGTPGYENSPSVILQGHLDMVCEKKPDCNLDMEREGLEVCTDGKNVWAIGTTLGGDDGIAVAYILAILDSKTIPHPPIEALFTSDEEIGMLGARALDTTLLHSKRMINIDSEEEGIIIVSCAGGVRNSCQFPFDSEDMPSDYTPYRISITGLKGGHSGMEIDKQRENSIKLLGNVLSRISRSCDIRLISLSGGGKENAIPSASEAVICVDSQDAHTLEFSCKEYLKLLHQELSITEPNLEITATPCEYEGKVMTLESSRRLIFSIHQIPTGLQKMSPEIPGLVQTSLNMGTCITNDDYVELRFMIRSNTGSGKQFLLERLTSFTEYMGGTITSKNDYPAWEYRIKSELREILVKSYKEIYGKAPEITAIHAGLECGILSGKMPDVDMISFGPTLSHVHTPNEVMDVASVERTWNYLKKILENMN